MIAAVIAVTLRSVTQHEHAALNRLTAAYVAAVSSFYTES